MGQYYHGVILDKDTRQPIRATYPEFMKLIESGLWDVSRMVYELSAKGRCYKQRVVWAGDYSERKDYDGETLVRYVFHTHVPEAMDKEFKKYPIKGEKFSEKWYDSIDLFFRQYVTDENDVIREEFRYLCNHDHKEWIDLMPFYTAKERRFWNPMAILTSDPTCRCKGGGDYYYKDDFEYYGAWSDCIISSEPAPPRGYRQIKPTFAAKHRIDGDELEQLLSTTSQTEEFTNSKTQNNMEANNMKAADLIGKTIIVGEDIATIVIKGADGDKLNGEFKKTGSTIGMPLPITMANLRQQIESGAWRIAGSEERRVKSEESELPNDPEPLTANHEPTAKTKARVQPKPAQEIEDENLTPDPSPRRGESDDDNVNDNTQPSDISPQTSAEPETDPVLKQWKEAKAKNPDAVIIFRNGNVYVAVAEDAEKLAEVAELKTAQHHGTAICVFPGGDLSAVMIKAVGANLRVKLEDLIVEDNVNVNKDKNVDVNDNEDSQPSDIGQEPKAKSQSKAAKPQPQSTKSQCTIEPEAGKPFIREVGKSIIVAGDTSKIEAVLLTMWGRKRPYTHKGKTYSGIQLSAKHKATVVEVIKLAS